MQKLQNCQVYKEKNGGVASALNLGITLSKGEYISWLSHDDLYKPDKIQKQIAFLSSQKSKDCILWSNYELIDEKGSTIAVTAFEASNNSYHLTSSMYPLFRGLIHGCSLLIPKSLLTQCQTNGKFFDESLKYTQDYDLWYKLFPNSSVFFMRDVLISSRVHANQDSKKIKSFEECDRLWIGMYKTLDETQIPTISESRESLVEELFDLTKGAHYVEASKFFSNEITRLKQSFHHDDLPAVSVILPFFNRTAITLEAIKSVLAQTLSNFELLIIDDASIEKNKELQQTIEGDKRVKFFKMPENGGAARARNLGIERAKGKYIAFLDSDDLWLPNKLEFQIKMMEEKKWKVSHTSYFRLTEETNEQSIISSGKTSYRLSDTISGCGIATPTVMINRQFLADNGLLFPTFLRSGEDVCLWIDLSERTIIHGVDAPLSIIRVDPSSTINNKYAFLTGLTSIIRHVAQKKYAYLETKSIERLLALLADNFIEQKVKSGEEQDTIEVQKIVLTDEEQKAVRRYTKMKNIYDKFCPPNTVRRRISKAVLTSLGKCLG